MHAHIQLRSRACTRHVSENGAVQTMDLGAWLVFKEALLRAVHVILYTLSEAGHFIFQSGSSAPAIRFKLLNIASTTFSVSVLTLDT